MQQSINLPTMNWADVLGIWRRFALVILLGGMAGGGFAYMLSRSMTPVFESGAVLLYSRPDMPSVGTGSEAARSDSQQRAAIVRSQVEIIRSREIIEGVIDRLQLRDRPSFQDTEGFLGRVADAVLPRIERLTGFDLRPQPQPVTETDPKEEMLRRYLDRLVVRHEPETYILRIGFRGPDRAEAAAIANAHAESYRAWLRSQQAGAVQENSVWLADAVESARQRVAAAEARVREYRANTGLVSIEGRTSLDEEIAQMSTELATAQAALVRSEVRAREISRMQAAGQLSALAALVDSRAFTELRDRFAAADAEVAGLRVDLGGRNPQLRAAAANRQQLQSALQNEIRALIQSEVSQASIARTSVTQLTEALNELKQRALDAENKRGALASLEAEAGAERAVYIPLLQRLRSLDKVAELSRSEAVLLSAASVPDRPIFPRYGVFTAFGFCLAAGVAAGGLAWRHGARDVIRHTADVEDAGEIRCIAVMPEFQRHRRTGALIRDRAKYSFFFQELRTVCGVLFREYAQSENGSVSVLVTSPLPGDGKSTFCRELGRCAALNGLPTLIVSLEDPPQDGSEEPGEVYELARGMPLYGVNLPGGGHMSWRRDTPTQIEAFQRQYDMVIIDAPPPAATAESFLLAPAADATIVLARVDRTPRSLLAKVTQEIGKAGGTLAGVVLSFAQLDSRRGLKPGDLGYYFSENLAYHTRPSASRLADDRTAASGRRMSAEP
jgi:uncharacterized protein involved in exopolysaccharide biosynthesis